MTQFCPIYSKECIQEKCTAYKFSTRQVFKDKKLNTFIAIDGLAFYLSLSSEDLQDRYVRQVKVIRECKMLGKILEIDEFEDQEIPNLGAMSSVS
jgi:hypothetical protein